MKTAVRVAFVLVAMALAGCDRPVPSGAPPARPSPVEPSAAAAPAPTTRAPVTPATTLGASASRGGFPDDIAVPCAGKPSADQLLSFLRRALSMPANANLTVRTGPLCSGTWQYTVVLQPNVDPLQVVTRGAPGALTLVTAGTDVCTAEVRTGAPYGIQAAAHC
jgi:hypothetical protein